MIPCWARQKNLYFLAFTVHRRSGVATMPRRPESNARKLVLPQTFVKLASFCVRDCRRQQLVYNEITQETVDLEIDKVLGVCVVGFVGVVGLWL